jgi:hypothetical protein
LKRLRSTVAVAMLVALAALALFCAFASFLGAAGAERFFNSLPLAAFWAALALLLAVRLFAGREGRRAPGLLAFQLGALLVLVGSICASGFGHRVARAITGRHKFRTGYLFVPEGAASDTVRDADGRRLGELPFSVALQDFRVERYAPERRSWELLFAPAPPASRAPIPLEWALGRDTPLAGTDLKVRALRYVDEAPPAETGEAGHGAPPSAARPAMEVLVHGDGGEMQAWLAPAPGAPVARLSLAPLLAGRPAAELYLTRPVGQVRQYVSHVAVLRQGQVVAEGQVRVNAPLRFAGYRLHQHSHGGTEAPHSVLLLSSESGWPAVAAGLVLLAAGAFWWCWLGPAIRHVRRRA